MPPGRENIEFPVTDHDGALGIDTLLHHDMCEEITLVVVATIEFGAVNGVEMRVEPEMFEDRTRHDMRLRGRDDQCQTRTAQTGQRLGNAGIDRCIEHRAGAVMVAIGVKSRFDLVHRHTGLGKAYAQRRADDPEEFIHRWDRTAELA